MREKKKQQHKHNNNRKKKFTRAERNKYVFYAGNGINVKWVCASVSAFSSLCTCRVRRREKKAAKIPRPQWKPRFETKEGTQFALGPWIAIFVVYRSGSVQFTENRIGHKIIDTLANLHFPLNLSDSEVNSIEMRGGFHETYTKYTYILYLLSFDAIKINRKLPENEKRIKLTHYLIVFWQKEKKKSIWKLTGWQDIEWCGEFQKRPVLSSRHMLLLYRRVKYVCVDKTIRHFTTMFSFERRTCHCIRN